MNGVRLVAGHEVHDALRHPWFWWSTVGFTALAALLANLALPGAQVARFGSFARSASSLVALCQIVVPIVGLVVGAQAIASRAERGSLRFLLVHPIGRDAAFSGIALGAVLATSVTLLAGFGTAALVSGMSGTATEVATFLRLLAFAWALLAAAVAVGLAVGSRSTRTTSAVGAAVAIWLGLVFLGDLGLLGMTVATDIPVSVLLFLTMLNPVEAFRLAALGSFPGSFDLLGPAGTYAVDRFGGGFTPILVVVLIVWIVVPATLAARAFTRRDL